MFKHFAFFIEGDEVKWTYGITIEGDPTSEQIEFQNTTVNFIQTLQAIGRELYSEGVASIKLDKTAESHSSLLTVNEIFIINLSDQFFFIISDLDVTSRLIRTKKIPFDIEQIIIAVLVGQAAILYATLITNQEAYNYDTDKIFRNILTILEIDKRHDLEDLVDRGRCSLSPLDVTELLLFHYMLRNYLETNATITINPWAIMVDKSGTDIPLSWLPPKDPYLLGNFLGAIYSYVHGLFGVRPSSITFGGHELTILQFYGGSNYFLAASNPKNLFLDPKFISRLEQIPKSKFIDIVPSIKLFVITILLQYISDLFSITDYDNLIKIIHSPIYNPTNKIIENNFKLIDIPGIGNKTVLQLNDLDIHSIKDLIEYPTNKFSSLSKNKAKKLLYVINNIKKWKEFAVTFSIKKLIKK